MATVFDQRALVIEIGLKDKKLSDDEIGNLNRELEHVNRRQLFIEETLKRIKSKETDEKVLQFWDEAQQ